MRKPNSRQEIVQQNREILNNIKCAEVNKHRDALQKKGHILLAEAKEQGFRKVGYDVFQRKEDIDAGNIWSVENIDGEDWLVCYTDHNDHILRNLKAAAKNHRMNKTAAIKEAVVINPGDLVEITPRHAESVHNKYKGKKGEATASMPDRTQLSFNDGSSLWIENTDLTVIKDRRELSVGDSVRMFSRKDVGGKVIKFSYDNKFVIFESAGGQELTARLNDLCKITKTGLVVQNIFTDPTSPDESKLLREYMKGQLQQQQPQGLEAPQQNIETAMTPDQGMGGMDEGFPPSIKARPSPAEMSAGTSMPASQLQMAANIEFVCIVKHGRRMNIGDQVQKKSTGEQGIIVDISFDKKLGKFYMIAFGGQEPDLVYDTDIMKLKPGKEYEMPAVGLPTDATPMRMPVGQPKGTPGVAGVDGTSKKAVLGPQFDNVKTAALEFVEGMVAQALKNHETTEPGTVVNGELENALVKQAITVYMSKYLPTDLKQVLSSEDKNELSQWLFTTAADIEAEAPTTEDFIRPTTAPEVDMWDLQKNYKSIQIATQDRATAKLSNELASHVPFAAVKPTELPTLRDKQKFVRDAVRTMITKGGMLVDAAHLITQHIASFKDINWPLLRRSLSKMGYKNTEQVLETAGDIFAFTSFETVDGRKYALDLPGMETLRGGGGGYPGGMDVDPMGWQVKSPRPGEPDQNQLQDALQENLADQSVPFEQAAPKINIELDPENKKIIIDYDQEEEPPIELEGATPLSPEPGAQPGVAGPGPGPQPGQVGGQQTPDGGAADLSGMNVPINF